MVDQVDQPSIVYRVTGDLYALAARLDQALGQLARALEYQLASGQLRVDGGTEFDGRPDVAVVTATDELRAAQRACRSVYDTLSAAQNAIAGL